MIKNLCMKILILFFITVFLGLCAKGRLCAPFRNPLFCRSVATLRISAHAPHPPKPQNRSEYLPIHPADIRFLFASPSAYAAPWG